MDISEIKVVDLQLFIAVVDSASMTAAAEHLQTTASTLSRRLKKLEGTLDARLLERTTRRHHLTDAGKLFYQHCQLVLDHWEAIGQEINNQQDTLEGRISIYAPQGLFLHFIQELVVGFSKQYPKLRLQFISGAAKPHLLKDNIDIMIHVDQPADSSFVARKINLVSTSYYASPDYLEKQGKPTHPGEMKDHECIMEVMSNRIPQPWSFTEGDVTTSIEVVDRFSADSVDLCLGLAEHGLGIALLPDFITRESVAAGKLLQLFDGRYGIKHNLYAVYASRHFVPRKTKAFLDFLIDHMPKEI
jgi:DNA-binding transcriptional LysR family regulator